MGITTKASFKRALLRRSAPEPRIEREPPAPAYATPTDDQLARFVAAVFAGGPALPFQVEGARLALTDPTTKRHWLVEHRRFQERIDRAAPHERALSRLREIERRDP